MSIRVLSPGTQSTLQDGGRHGWRALGVARAGAADALSLEVANRLVGNAPHAPALELAWSGPRLRVERGCTLALAGADAEARLGGDAAPMHRPFFAAADTILEIGAIRGGARAYLAVAGGFDAGSALGSASTDLTAGFGGIGGRPLRRDDVLALRATEPPRPDAGSAIAHWWIAPPPHLPLPQVARLRVLPGAHAGASLQALCAREWRISSSASRMGLRLEGEPLDAGTAGLVSEPVAIGTVQLPPDGQPIVLGVEAQTVGGYPRVAHVIAADWPALGQLRPGDSVRFALVGDADAAAALAANRTFLARVAEAIASKRGEPPAQAAPARAERRGPNG